eukprot:5706663-Ditylum_brightwellii.AAC.1
MPWIHQIPLWFYPYLQVATPPKSNVADWPKFSKGTLFYLFYLKLSTILESPEWGNGELISTTHDTDALAQKLALLFQGLLSCLEDEPLLPFVNNAKNTNKGIDMFQELFCTYDGFKGKTDQEMIMDFYSCKINPGKSIDDFALCLCTLSICLQAFKVTVTKFQLTNTFVYGLYRSFKDVKAANDKKTL